MLLLSVKMDEKRRMKETRGIRNKSKRREREKIGGVGEWGSRKNKKNKNKIKK